MSACCEATRIVIGSMADEDERILNKKQQFEALASELTWQIGATRKRIKAQFPRRVIRTLNSFKNRWPYLSKERARTVACTIQLCDINKWHLNVWAIELTAGTLWEWHCTLPVICVIETLCREFSISQGFTQEHGRFAKVLLRLKENEVISPQLWQELDSLREYRDQVHLYLREKVEMHDGYPKRYNWAVRTLHELEEQLIAYTGGSSK